MTSFNIGNSSRVPFIPTKFPAKFRWDRPQRLVIVFGMLPVNLFHDRSRIFSPVYASRIVSNLPDSILFLNISVEVILGSEHCGNSTSKWLSAKSKAPTFNSQIDVKYDQWCAWRIGSGLIGLGLQNSMVVTLTNSSWRCLVHRDLLATKVFGQLVGLNPKRV